MTALLKVDAVLPEPEIIHRAAACIRSGGLVAFPTETVYGLGANAVDPDAVDRIFAAKGRPSYNPLIVHVPDAIAAGEVAEWSALAERCAAAFWPGPLTLVLPKRAPLPPAVTAGLESVAVRSPAHPVAQALLRTAALPIAAPSANRSAALSPTTAEHVQRSLGGAVDLVLDGGPTPVGIESTVLSLVGDTPTVLRPGTIGVDSIRALLGEVAVAGASGDDKTARPSPGMLDRHYSPRAQVRLFDSAEPPALVARKGAGALLLQTELDIEHPIRMPADPARYASRLYAELHRLDDLGCKVIWIERVPAGAAWAGVRDRLARASHPG